MENINVSIERKKKANGIFRFRTLLATGTGFVPVPLLDAAGIMTIQVWMVRDLAKVYGIPFKKHLVKSLIGTLMGNIGSAGLIKFIPGLGQLLGGGAVAATGGAATYALGKVFTQHFDQGGTLLSFDPVRSREYFQKSYEEELAKFKKTEQPVPSQSYAPASENSAAMANANLMASISAMQQQIEQLKNNKEPEKVAQPSKKWGFFGWLFRLLVLLLLLLAVRWGIKTGYFGRLWGSIGTKPETVLPITDVAPDGAANLLTGAAPTKGTQNPVPENAAKPVAQRQAIGFQQGSLELAPEALQQAARIVSLLLAQPGASLKIYFGAAPDGGGEEAGQLSMQRALTLETLLKQNGVNEGQLSVSPLSGEGNSNPDGIEVELLPSK